MLWPTVMYLISNLMFCNLQLSASNSKINLLLNSGGRERVLKGKITTRETPPTTLSCYISNFPWTLHIIRRDLFLVHIKYHFQINNMQHLDGGAYSITSDNKPIINNLLILGIVSVVDRLVW